MARPPLLHRAAPFLGIAWAGLGAFFLWDAGESGDNTGYLLGISALVVAAANLAIFLRR